MQLFHSVAIVGLNGLMTFLALLQGTGQCFVIRKIILMHRLCALIDKCILAYDAVCKNPSRDDI